MNTVDELVQKVIAGDRPALARTLSLIEDNVPAAERILEALFPRTGQAVVIGITGSPGAGKSTLVDQLVTHLAKERGKKVAVLAVDPSSPFSGGALLGDRIRMAKAVEHPNVFVRSMASRGALGGLAPRTAELLFVFDAAGFDYVVVETVGVGQGEVEIVRMADSVVVVLVPGMGDSVQALKAGILEIADIFAINKADYDGANRLEKELLALLTLQEARPWKPPIVRTIATEGKGITDLEDAINRHHAWGKESGNLESRRKRLLREVFQRHLIREIEVEVKNRLGSDQDIEKLMEPAMQRRRSPSALAAETVRNVLGRLA